MSDRVKHKVKIIGRNISSQEDKSGRFIVLGETSAFSIPISVQSEAVYKIDLEICCKNGNGFVYCNINNDGYDFQTAKIICTNQNWTNCSFEVSTKKLTGPVCALKFTRGSDGTGTLFVRNINVGFIISNSSLQGIIQRRRNMEEFIKNSEVLKNPRVVAPSLTCLKSAGNIELFKNKVPKITPTIVNDFKVSVVISTFNRKDFLARSLLTYQNQTMDKNDFEIVIVDDGSDEDIKGLCKESAEKMGLKIQYILVDKYKGEYVPKSFNQALTNNIGFKNARGAVIVITGPETLLKETNLEVSWDVASKGYCVYGNVLRSSTTFMDLIFKNENWHQKSFNEIMKWEPSPQDINHCAGFWWYYVAVKKEFIMDINGVDERFMEGITAEDDNFAFRMNVWGVPLIREPNLIGIHQNHSREDQADLHSVRSNNPDIWRFLRNHNVNLLNMWWKTQDPIANRDIDWGTDKAIVEKLYF